MRNANTITPKNQFKFIAPIVRNLKQSLFNDRQKPYELYVPIYFKFKNGSQF